MIGSRSLGVSMDGEVLRLSFLSRQFSTIKIRDFLTIEDFRQKPLAEVRKEVSTFLRKNKAHNDRCVLAVPRRDVIVRQIDLPKEAEANLAKVVEYQLANLLPSEDTAICHDFCMSKLGTDSKTFQVSIFLVLKSIMQHRLNSCEELGLKVNRVIPSSLGMANYFLMLQPHFRTSPALIGYVADQRCEMVGLLNKGFHWSREFSITDNQSFSEALRGEMESFRAQARLREETVLNVFLIGKVEGGQEIETEDQRFRVYRLAQPQSFGLRFGKVVIDGNKIQDHFLALVAALSGLRRKVPVLINLLPAEKRVRKSKWRLAPTYALLGVNLVLALSLVLRKPVQQRMFSSQLNREVSRLEPEVKKIRTVEKQIADVRRRSELLMNFKKSNSLVLDALNELSKILPKNTWVYDFNMKNRVMEIYGASDAAAALPQILDNSPYFKEAEFIGSITKDGSGKEIYRIRMKIESEQLLAAQK